MTPEYQGPPGKVDEMPGHTHSVKERDTAPADDLELPECPAQWWNHEISQWTVELKEWDTLRSLARKLKERIKELEAVRDTLNEHIHKILNERDGQRLEKLRWIDQCTIEHDARVEAERKLAEAEQRAGKDREDAERYRWLRDIAPISVRERISGKDDYEMDAAIDAARKEGK